MPDDTDRFTIHGRRGDDRVFQALIKMGPKALGRHLYKGDTWELIIFPPIPEIMVEYITELRQCPDFPSRLTTCLRCGHKYPEFFAEEGPLPHVIIYVTQHEEPKGDSERESYVDAMCQRCFEDEREDAQAIDVILAVHRKFASHGTRISVEN